MLNLNKDTVNSFANRNSVLVDTTGDTFDQKDIFHQIITSFKGEADSILDEEDIREGYYYIHPNEKNGRIGEKAKINTDNVKKKANKYADETDFDDEKYVPPLARRTLFIAEQTRNNNSFNFISEKDSVILEKRESVLEGIRICGTIFSKDDLRYCLEKGIIKKEELKEELFNFFKNFATYAYDKAFSPTQFNDYHDLDHDLVDEESMILAYFMEKGYFGDVEILMLNCLLEESGDDEQYFYDLYYDENLLENKLELLLEGIEES